MNLLMESLEPYDVNDPQLQAYLNYVQKQIAINGVKAELSDVQLEAEVKQMYDTSVFEDTGLAIKQYEAVLDRFPTYHETVQDLYRTTINNQVKAGDGSVFQYIQQSLDAGYMFEDQQHFKVERKESITIGDYPEITEMLGEHLDPKNASQSLEKIVLNEKPLENQEWKDITLPTRAFVIPNFFPDKIFAKEGASRAHEAHELFHLGFAQAFPNAAKNSVSDISELMNNLGFPEISKPVEIDEVIAAAVELKIEPKNAISLAGISLDGDMHTGYGPNVNLAADSINRILSNRGLQKSVEDFKDSYEFTQYFQANPLLSTEADGIVQEFQVTAKRLLTLMPQIEAAIAQKTDSPPRQP